MKNITLETLYIYNIEKELATITEPLPYPLLSKLTSIDGLKLKGRVLWGWCLIK